MSKQNLSKGNPGARPAGATSKQSSTRPTGAGQTPPKSTGATAKSGGGTPATYVRNNRATGARGQVQVKRKSGFRLRPLDIALIIAGVLVVGFIVMSGLQSATVRVDANAGVSADAQQVPMGAVAPDFSLVDTNGTTHKLSDQKGKVVVLEFMATWCPHCQDDAPMFNDLNAQYKDKGVQIFGVNATPRGHVQGSNAPATMDDLKWFRDNFKVSFPLLFDPQLKSAQDYGVLSYPSIYVVDKEGKISFQPPTDKLPTIELLSGEIDKALAK
ncbi:MAG: TlpA disulfide reductase family protein [Chloroflexota bacterium]